VATYGQPDVKVGITTSTTTGAAVNDISQYVETLSGPKPTAKTQQTDAFGDSWVENSYTGVREGGTITLGGRYNDVAASGPHILFGQIAQLGAYREIEIDYGASDIVRCPVIITSYERTPNRGELTGYTLEAMITGAITTAT
jgi:hypothetical protein